MHAAVGEIDLRLRVAGRPRAVVEALVAHVGGRARNRAVVDDLAAGGLARRANDRLITTLLRSWKVLGACVIVVFLQLNLVDNLGHKSLRSSRRDPKRGGDRCRVRCAAYWWRRWRYPHSPSPPAAAMTRRRAATAPRPPS